jgi:hypothetical protein
MVNIRDLVNDPSKGLLIVERVSKTLKAGGNFKAAGDYEEQALAADDFKSLLKVTRKYVNTIEV